MLTVETEVEATHLVDPLFPSLSASRDTKSSR